jgi:hypothetical protein
MITGNTMDLYKAQWSNGEEVCFSAPSDSNARYRAAAMHATATVLSLLRYSDNGMINVL